MADYSDLIARASKKYGVPANLIQQVINVESSGNPTAASGTGPVGLMQVSKGLARQYGYDLKDRLDPAKNIEMGTRYLADNLKAFKGNVTHALLGYNQGTGGAKQMLSGKIPMAKEGYNYIRNKKFSPEYISANSTIPVPQAPTASEAPSTQELLTMAKQGMAGKGQAIPTALMPKPIAPQQPAAQTQPQPEEEKPMSLAQTLTHVQSLVSNLFSNPYASDHQQLVQQQQQQLQAQMDAQRARQQSLFPTTRGFSR